MAGVAQQARSATRSPGCAADDRGPEDGTPATPSEGLDVDALAALGEIPAPAHQEPEGPVGKAGEAVGVVQLPRQFGLGDMPEDRDVGVRRRDGLAPCHSGMSPSTPRFRDDILTLANAATRLK